MIGQHGDAFGEDRDLYIRRTGVTLVAMIIADDLGFDFLVERHDVCFSFFIFTGPHFNRAGLHARSFHREQDQSLGRLLYPKMGNLR